MATVRSKRGYLYLDYHDEAGKRHRDALFLKDTRENRKKAELEKKKIEYELGAGVYIEKKKRIDANKKTLKQGLHEFLSSKKNRSPETIKDYEFAFKNMTDYFGDIKINRIDPDNIENLEKHLQLRISENSIASYFKKIKVIFEYFKKVGYISVNPIPTRQMKLDEPVTIPRKEIESILQKLKIKNRTHYRVIALLLLTGMRISELLRLTFEDIDFRENIMLIRNQKGRRIDRFPIYEELGEFLITEFPGWKGPLFNYKSKDSMKFFKRFLVDEGYPNYNFHNLRKTFISKLINSGMNVFDVMKLARHKSIQTTLNHYSAAELTRMGKEITKRANMGTLLGTRNKKGLKLVKKRRKIMDVA